uniref:Uncharacterized protein n=1 Tax=Candidatus Kentrum sp. LPFa TaxID=2126335 RepID=A0A450X548_9GAMM|nr:MAG: hypothetical protein BECKLPF1236A_GA0070988_104183 [Candidatus Kentron sp. LPFa]VFK35841.1 MAG: hypothetical protein BECKLPF1236C_GA0070990_104323 [Candidatus Kentron sp. LPFa]
MHILSRKNGQFWAFLRYFDSLWSLGARERRVSTPMRPDGFHVGPVSMFDKTSLFQDRWPIDFIAFLLDSVGNLEPKRHKVFQRYLIDVRFCDSHHAPKCSARAYRSSTPMRSLNSGKVMRRSSSPSVAPSVWSFRYISSRVRAAAKSPASGYRMS